MPFAWRTPSSFPRNVVTFGCALSNVSAIVVMPEATPRRPGAEVKLFSATYDEAEA